MNVTDPNLAATLNVLSQTENYGGFPSFCSLIIIIILDRYKIKFNDFKFLVTLMVYFDCVGLLVNWATPMWATATICQSTWLNWVGDMIYSGKDTLWMFDRDGVASRQFGSFVLGEEYLMDAFRCGFIAWKALLISQPHMTPKLVSRLTITVMILSFLLYQTFIWTTYSFSGQYQARDEPSMSAALTMEQDWITAMGSAISLVILYMYWFSIEVSSAIAMVYTLRMGVKIELLAHGTEENRFVARVLYKETWRICWATLLESTVSGCAIAELVNQRKYLYLKGCLFTLSQFMLVLTMIDSPGGRGASTTVTSEPASRGTVSTVLPLVAQPSPKV
ncbi:uncharacterized protein BJ171DRAFT_474743 [Polychytrium aggregatum]|uniref:uncharacterized protein n=1 Tax=Polychytrium aggregatum TaxID=110093 RepID=UPI0022FE331B|nr:uncharacterized protein BJ171DRAFT_474743 [Polychytrium aggregatum]KAI9204920.1 hypothetical protein BJ171DRAFT_474743 [Polychytrium aggregatum]